MVIRVGKAVVARLLAIRPRTVSRGQSGCLPGNRTLSWSQWAGVLPNPEVQPLHTRSMLQHWQPATKGNGPPIHIFSPLRTCQSMAETGVMLLQGAWPTRRRGSLACTAPGDRRVALTASHPAKTPTPQRPQSHCLYLLRLQTCRAIFSCASVSPPVPSKALSFAAIRCHAAAAAGSDRNPFAGTPVIRNLEGLLVHLGAVGSCAFAAHLAVLPPTPNHGGSPKGFSPPSARGRPILHFGV
mmetsp:Transcript_25338/g.41129  ORF Transcript_25338/g.41129 Transcript_25338/m.41129 type:complete len:241 (+) Transcript_25338:183-905(+)